LRVPLAGGAWVPGDPRDRTPDLRAEALCVCNTTRPDGSVNLFPGMVRVVRMKRICRFSTAGSTLFGLDRSRVRSSHRRQPGADNVYEYIFAPLRYILSPSMRTVLRGYAAVFCSRKAISLVCDAQELPGSSRRSSEVDGPPLGLVRVRFACACSRRSSSAAGLPRFLPRWDLTVFKLRTSAL